MQLLSLVHQFVDVVLCVLQPSLQHGVVRLQLTWREEEGEECVLMGCCILVYGLIGYIFKKKSVFNSLLSSLAVLFAPVFALGGGAVMEIVVFIPPSE